MLGVAQGLLKIMPDASGGSSESSVTVEELLIEVVRVQQTLRRLLFEAGELIAKTQRLRKEIIEESRQTKGTEAIRRVAAD